MARDQSRRPDPPAPPLTPRCRRAPLPALPPLALEPTLSPPPLQRYGCRRSPPIRSFRRPFSQGDRFGFAIPLLQASRALGLGGHLYASTRASRAVVVAATPSRTGSPKCRRPERATCFRRRPPAEQATAELSKHRWPFECPSVLSRQYHPRHAPSLSECAPRREALHAERSDEGASIVAKSGSVNDVLQ